MKEILNAYTSGKISFEEANAALVEIGKLPICERGKFTKEQIADGWGLLDSGTATLDPVQSKDGELIGCECGEFALYFMGGKCYEVTGKKLA